VANPVGLASYVLHNYARLMSPHERAVMQHLTILYKGRRTPPPAGTASHWSEEEGHYTRLLSSEPEVLADADAGWDVARERIANRILSTYPSEVYLNRCPNCRALTATPTARLCPACGHTWFHVPRDERL